MVNFAAVFFGNLHVVSQHRTVVGVSDGNETLGALHVADTAQVGNTVFCDDGTDEVAGVVDV